MSYLFGDMPYKYVGQNPKKEGHLACGGKVLLPMLVCDCGQCQSICKVLPAAWFGILSLGSQ